MCLSLAVVVLVLGLHAVWGTTPCWARTSTQSVYRLCFVPDVLVDKTVVPVSR
ncbi:hypothetical protein [Goodfellowiella coeruleoviolacea]|uniref:Uncharacterized protein n=1 Tax=Goodfellowiella coeruleoviolacea TaxID=334858 RepID=A0AAE3GF96_9PSEU|nr:hypothetical protein [Goodfellowiella coeruleoviolacea]MCP2167131.1 hypothetical protein [Goodfellowiella coeruleoviolacea]